jgi:tetratricopeptide (TPR) repeat protein
MSDELLIEIERFTDPVQFERLCSDVMSDLGYRGIDPQGVGRKDGGKDALAWHPKHGQVVFHYSLRKDWRRKLQEDIAKVLANDIKCDQFVFCTNQKVSPHAKDALKAECKTKLGADLEIFDRERIRVCLVTNSDICLSYFPKSSLKNLLPELLETSIKKLLNRGIFLPDIDVLSRVPAALEAKFLQINGLLAGGQAFAAIEKAHALAKLSTLMTDATLNFLHYVGCCLYEEGSLRDAKEAFQKLLEVQPSHFGAAINVAIVLEHDDNKIRYGGRLNPIPALQAYRRALRCASTSVQKSICNENVAALLHYAGRRRSVLQHYNMLALREDPNNLSAQFNLAANRDNWQERESATLSLLKEEISRIPLLEERIRFQLAQCDFFLRGDRRAALLKLRGTRSIRVMPHYFNFLFLVAHNRKKYSKAIYYATKSMQIDFYRPEAHKNYGQILQALGRFSEAANAYRVATEMDPSDSTAYEGIAVALEAENLKKNFPSIKQNLLIAIQKSPRRAKLHYMLGDLYLEMKMFGSAKRAFEVEISLYPESSDGHFGLGRLYEFGFSGIRYGKREDMLKAIEHYGRALTLNSKGWGIAFNLGVLHLTLQETDEALKMFELADELHPDHDGILTNLGITWLKKGDRAKGAQLLTKALRLNPTNEYAKHTVFQLLQNLGPH